MWLIPLGWWAAVLLSSTRAMPRPFEDWKELLLYGGAAVAIGAALHRRATALRLTVPVFLFVLYLLWGGFGLLVDPRAAMESLLVLARVGLWGGLAFAIAQWSPREWRRVAAVSVTVAAAIVVASWIDLRLVKFTWLEGNFLPFIGHVSYFGCVMALHLPLAAWLLATARTRAAQLRWGAALALIAVGCWMAGSRASLVAVTGALALIASLLWTEGRRRVVLLTGAAVAAGVAALLLLRPPTARGIATAERLAQLWRWPSAETIDAISGGRWLRYRTTGVMLVEHPGLGVGLGHFRYVYPEYGQRLGRDETFHEHAWFMHPHNELLHQAAEMGLPGMVLAILLVGSLCTLVVRRYRRGDKKDRPLLLVAIAGWTIAGLDWQFSTTFLTPTVRLLTALYGGLLWRLVGGDAAPLSRLRHRGWRPGLAAMAAVASLACVGYGAGLSVGAAVWRGRPWTRRYDGVAIAQYLAPGTFETRYLTAVTTLRGQDAAAARTGVETLVHHYPYVPAVLYITAQLRVREGHPEAARELLRHALRNCPTFGGAMELLAKIEGE